MGETMGPTEQRLAGEKSAVRIAIVDDDDDIVDVLGEVLRRSGYTPDLYTNPRDAALASTSQEYDVVISDLAMPGISGIDLLTQVKDAFPLTQFIMITGYASVKSAAEAMHRGANSYLTKPLTSTQILAHLENAVEKRLLALENERLVFELTTANEQLENKVQELEHTNQLLRQTQQELVKVERVAAIGEVVVSINHCINNSLSGIGAAVRFVKSEARVTGDADAALDRIDAECKEIEAVMGRLKLLKEASTSDYVDGIKMIDLKEEEVDATV
jgi:FixJ family two-component response regulator